jgi:tellurite resistance protein
MNSARVKSLPCPICGTRPCETSAKAVWVRGFLLAYQISRKQLIGCVQCVRGELLKEAGMSAILGWFSITAIFINPVLIVYNLIRSLTVRENPEAVARKLTELGINPSSEEVSLLQITYSMIASLIAADGKLDPSEIQVATNIGTDLFDSFSIDQFKKTCERHQELPTPMDLGLMLRDILEEESKALLFRYAVAVSQADGSISPEEEAVLLAIADGMDFDINSLTTSGESKENER